MSPQYRFARRLVASVAALSAVATGFVRAEADTPSIYNGEIAFMREYPSSGGSLPHAIRPDGTDIHALAVTGLAYAYSPDGTRLAYGSSGGVWILDLTTNENALAIPGSSPTLSLSWSPDGSTLAWAAGGTKLTMASVDGTNTRTILDTDDASESNPVFIPGTSRLAFIRAVDGSRDIWTVELDGSDARVLIPEANSANFGLDVSPDGSRVTFFGAVYKVMMANIDGTGLHVLTSGGVAKFSPDSEWIVFSRGGDPETAETTGLWLIRVNGTDLHQLTQGEDVFAAWQPRMSPLPELPTTTSSSTTTSTSTTTTTTTLPNQAPVPKFAKFAQYKPHYVVASGAPSTDIDGTIVNYQWRWGDGSPPSNGKQAWHQYKRSGWALIRLTVTDDKGASVTRGVWYYVN